MSNNLVITIGRQNGSGGRKIGFMLAEELGVKCYDRELLTLAAKSSGLCEDILEAHDETATNSFLYSLVMDTYALGYTSSTHLDMPINHKVFLAQFDVIKELAQKEACVIVGRCADYALSEHNNVVNIFITADDEDRVAKIAKTNSTSFDKAKELLIKTDKKRSSYYNYYSNKRWGDSRSYDLCINSSRLGYTGVVEFIKSYIDIKSNKAPSK